MSRNDGVLKNPHEQISFMNKPDLIQMHLDILYKSVSFISNDKILTILEEYKTTKEEKRKEEEDRMMQQLLMKKSRGRQSSNKVFVDQEMEEDDPTPKIPKQERDFRTKNSLVDMSKDWRKESLDKAKLLNKRQPIPNQNHNSFSKDKVIPTLKKSPTVDLTPQKSLNSKKVSEKAPSDVDQNMEGESSDLTSSADISLK